MIKEGSMKASAGLQRCSTWQQLDNGSKQGTLPYYRVSGSMMLELQGNFTTVIEKDMHPSVAGS